MRLTFWYILFAVIATIANIGSQDIAIRLYDGRSGITLYILGGTAVGLLVKYILERRISSGTVLQTSPRTHRRFCSTLPWVL